MWVEQTHELIKNVERGYDSSDAILMTIRGGDSYERILEHAKPSFVAVRPRRMGWPEITPRRSVSCRRRMVANGIAIACRITLGTPRTFRASYWARTDLGRSRRLMREGLLRNKSFRFEGSE